MPKTHFLVAYRNCAVCQRSIEEAFNYCPQCGERQPERPELEWAAPQKVYEWSPENGACVTTVGVTYDG